MSEVLEGGRWGGPSGTEGREKLEHLLEEGLGRGEGAGGRASAPGGWRVGEKELLVGGETAKVAGEAVGAAGHGARGDHGWLQRERSPVSKSSEKRSPEVGATIWIGAGVSPVAVAVPANTVTVGVR